MTPAYMVWDDFLRNPQTMLDEFASMRSSLKQDRLCFATGRSRFARRLARRFEQQLGRPLAWRWDLGSGTYRWFTERHISAEASVLNVHQDAPITHVFLLYLNRPAECHGGTGLFRHRLTGLDDPTDRRAVERVLRRFKWSWDELADRIARDATDPGAWELTDLIQMRFNRLVWLDSRRFHSHVLDFARARKPSRRLIYVSYADGEARGVRRQA